MEAFHPSRTMQMYNSKIICLDCKLRGFVRPYIDIQLYNLKACTWFADQFRV